MDDQSSPSNPKPPTQTLTANRKTIPPEEQHHSREYDYTKVVKEHNAVYFASYLSVLLNK